MVRLVAQFFEVFGQELGPRGALALGSARYASNGIPSHLLGIEAGQSRGARGPAPGCIVKLRVPQPIGGQGIEMRRGDLASIASQVRKPQVVGDDQDHIGALRRHSGGHGP